jgi:hypothetical protein
MSNMCICVVRIHAGVRELPSCPTTLEVNTLKTRTGKIHFAMTNDLAKLAERVSTHLLFRRKPTDLRASRRSAGSCRQPADILPDFTASDAHSGHLERLWRSECI